MQFIKYIFNLYDLQRGTVTDILCNAQVAEKDPAIETFAFSGL